MLKGIKKESDVIFSTDLFNEIITKVKEAGKWPDDLVDYASTWEYGKTGIYNYMFEPEFVLSPGSNEGYFLTLSIRGNYRLTDDAVSTLYLGAIKTLGKSEESVRRMSALYGECLIAYEKIMSENLDSFTRKGYDLIFMDDKGNRKNCGWSGFKDVESALATFKAYKETHKGEGVNAIIRNNLTREEKILKEESSMLKATNWKELKKQLRQLETRGKVVFKLERTNSMNDGTFCRVLYKVKPHELIFLDGNQKSYLPVPMEMESAVEYFENGFKICNCTYTLDRVEK